MWEGFNFFDQKRFASGHLANLDKSCMLITSSWWPLTWVGFQEIGHLWIIRCIALIKVCWVATKGIFQGRFIVASNSDWSLLDLVQIAYYLDHGKCGEDPHQLTSIRRMIVNRSWDRCHPSYSTLIVGTFNNPASSTFAFLEGSITHGFSMYRVLDWSKEYSWMHHTVSFAWLSIAWANEEGCTTVGVSSHQPWHTLRFWKEETWARKILSSGGDVPTASKYPVLALEVWQTLSSYYGYAYTSIPLPGHKTSYHLMVATKTLLLRRVWAGGSVSSTSTIPNLAV